MRYYFDGFSYGVLRRPVTHDDRYYVMSSTRILGPWTLRRVSSTRDPLDTCDVLRRLSVSRYVGLILSFEEGGGHREVTGDDCFESLYGPPFPLYKFPGSVSSVTSHLNFDSPVFNYWSFVTGEYTSRKIFFSFSPTFIW